MVRLLMEKKYLQFIGLIVAIVSMLLWGTARAETAPSKIGIIIMHGKGGMPTKHVAGLASSLEAKGYLIANLEMPWSGKRDYDVNVDTAEREIESALTLLQSKGAEKRFIAGHSQGGVFALYLGGKHKVDGIIAIAPGGDVGGIVFKEKLGDSVERARQLIAEGKGEEKTRLTDYEGAKGVYPVIASPSAYLSWFDPNGAMSEKIAISNMNPQIPVLFIAPKNDYPGLRKTKQIMFDLLPKHPLTQLYEPNSTHIDAPSASLEEIIRWIAEVARGACTGSPC